MGLMIDYQIFTKTKKPLQIVNDLIDVGIECQKRGFEIVGEKVEVSKDPPAIQLVLQADKGCENCNITFRLTNNGWYCDSSCKTQFSTNFKKSHIAIINIFDMLKAKGYIVEIDDEGEYWEKRDLKKAIEIQQSIKKLMDNFVKFLTKDKSYPKSSIRCRG